MADLRHPRVHSQRALEPREGVRVVLEPHEAETRAGKGAEVERLIGWWESG